MQRFEPSDPVRVGLASLEPLHVAGFQSLFDKLPGLTPVWGSLESLLADESLGVILLHIDRHLDAGQDEMGLLASVRSVRSARPDMRVIVMGPESDDGVVMEAIQTGARGFLDVTANPLTVQKAIAEVLAGEIWARRRVLSRLIDRLTVRLDGLIRSEKSDDKIAERLTEREHQVVDLILEAQSNQEIARQLGIGESTVKSHVSSVMRKAGAANRVELSLWALHGDGRRHSGI